MDSTPLRPKDTNQQKLRSPSRANEHVWNLSFPILLALVLTSCTADPQTPNLESESTQFLLSRVSNPQIDSILQRNGFSSPEYITDVKSTGMALINLRGSGPKCLLLTCGSNLDRWKNGQPGFDPLLFEFSSDLQLKPIPEAAGIPALRWTSSCAAADLDADGDDDLLLTGLDGSLLLENVDGRFRPVIDSGIITSSWCTSVAFADLDLDGDLDIFICRYLDFPFEAPPVNGEEWSCLWENQPVLCGPRGLPANSDLVFENLGNWRFADRTADWGFDKATPGYGLAVTAMNMFGDAHPEIIVANDSTPNHLWTRREDGTWLEDGLLAGLGVDQDGQEQAGMGIALAGIYPPNGLDVVITNFERESVNLYVNEGSGTYRDIATSTGISNLTRSALSWGIGIADFNLDGLADIMISNGHVYPQANSAPVSPGYGQFDQLLLGIQDNDKKLRFESAKSMIQNPKRHVGRGLILADLDDDGDVDAISSTLNGAPQIYRNNSNPRSNELLTSVVIKLDQPGNNRQGIGSLVKVIDANPPLSLPVLRQSSFQSSGVASVIFPLKTMPNENQIQVIWPNGTTENFPVTSSTMTLKKGSGQKP